MVAYDYRQNRLARVPDVFLEKMGVKQA